MTGPAVAIAGRSISASTAPFIVAEMSANHLGRKDRAFEIIDAAKAAGADAVKLQTYRPETITCADAGAGQRIESGPWEGKTLYELYEEAHTPWQWHEELFEHARDVDITLFSSPFDPTAVDLLEELGCPAYKIASFELVDTPLIEKAAGTSKPLIMSTGMSTWDEVEDAVGAARRTGGREIVLLHAVSAYPTAIEEADLLTIPELTRRFQTVVGLSDHTLGTTTAIVAVALGARLIEKHLTLARGDSGPDAAFSLEPHELQELVERCKEAWLSLGEARSGPTESERSSQVLRRSLHVVRDVHAGDRLTEEDIRSLRPAGGLPPKLFGEVIGRRVRHPVKAGTPLQWEQLEDSD